MLDNPKLNLKQSPFEYVGTQKLTLDDWVAIPDNPIQRDTAKRAKSASHLMTFSPSHLRVAIGVLPDRRTFKVDGHTRAFLWSTQKVEGLPSPLVLNADVYQCRDREALIELYSHFDSRSAVELPADQVFGASRELGLHFKSPILASGRYGTPIKRLYNIVNGYGAAWADAKFTYLAINYFRDELLMFDATEPKHNDYGAPIIMAAILTFMRYGAGASEFWVRYGRNEGVKSGQTCDGVQALRNMIAEMKIQKKTGTPFYGELIGRALNAFERSREGRMYTGKMGIPQIKAEAEMARFVEMARKAKEARR